MNATLLSKHIPPNLFKDLELTATASFCLGNILGPLTFTSSSAPSYIPAKITIVVTCAVASLLALVLRAYYSWENRRRDKLAAARGVLDGGEHVVGAEFADVTDRKNMEFRYKL